MTDLPIPRKKDHVPPTARHARSFDIMSHFNRNVRVFDVHNKVRNRRLLAVWSDYRITVFGASNSNATPDGRQFYLADVEEHFRPSGDLLRDHYRQCVLACMKAATGPVHLRWFDPDINLGPGGFNLEEGSWWSGPEGKEQMEVELAARLHRTLVSRV